MKINERFSFTSLLAMAAVGLAMVACSSATSVPTCCGLSSGMTDTEFLATEDRCRLSRSFYSPKGEGGGAPPPMLTEPVGLVPGVSAPGPLSSVQVGDDVWDVWAYRVWRGGLVDHTEHAVFKNKRLVAWGVGFPSPTLLAQPDQVAE